MISRSSTASSRETPLSYKRSSVIQKGCQDEGEREELSIKVLEAVKELKSMLGKEVENGALDITFFRDDFRMKGNVPLMANSTQIDFIVEGKNVIFVDDVLWTGRTIRSAMDAIQAFGRAQRIELLVLVDRRFSRQIPIEPDYIGIQVDSIDSQKVIVSWEEVDKEDSIILVTEKK